MAGKIRHEVEPDLKVSLFETYDNKNPQFEKVLLKGKDVTRVFLILCYINEVRAIMEAAESLDMTKGEYAFITLDLNTDVFYKDGQWTGNNGKGSRFPDILNGIIDLSVYRPEVSEEFKKRYKEMENQLEPSIKTNLHHEPSWYASFLYDAVYLYSLAVNATLASGYDITNTSEVLLRMFNRYFHGKSGHVLMENGTRVPEFVVGNLRDGSYKFIGNKNNLLHNDSGSIYHKLRLISKSEINWPGGSSRVPVSVPVCGFTGKGCHQGKKNKDHLSVILGVSGACLLVIIIFVLLIYAKRRVKEQENVHKKWIINYKEIAPSDDIDADTPMMLSNFHQVSPNSISGTKFSLLHVLYFLE
ncbi:hypothetical protein OS493_013643 [Desmophyllum pertusum]|uniref:Receptor ligand binding region domain-containing protein n=1 Tax=Desmophyllum pertusum TaxID=174260 RepID=A0A9X0DBS7_9CNID|nr:hypothetical protein OS493_013643 [Desmophyllum pertusum]